MKCGLSRNDSLRRNAESSRGPRHRLMNTGIHKVYSSLVVVVNDGLRWFVRCPSRRRRLVGGGLRRIRLRVVWVGRWLRVARGLAAGWLVTPVGVVLGEVALEEAGVLDGPVRVLLEPAGVVDEVVGVCREPVLDGVLGFRGRNWRRGLVCRRSWLGVGLGSRLAVLEASADLAPFLLPPSVRVTAPFPRTFEVGVSYSLAVVLREGNGGYCRPVSGGSCRVSLEVRTIGAVFRARTALLNALDEGV